MNRTYVNDYVKEKAIGKYGNFLDRTILKYKSPKKVKVVFLPGAEEKSDGSLSESLELKMYDSRGIPRENIVGLECFAEEHARLKKADCGIKLTDGPMDAYDFFGGTRERFDVISLDYKGQRTWKERDITRYIAGKGLLENKGIYCTNHFIQREGVDMKLDFLHSLMSQTGLSTVFDNLSPGLSGASFNEEVNEEFDRMINWTVNYEDKLRNKKGDLNELRHQITAGNLQILGGGLIEMDPSRSIFSKNKTIQEYLSKVKKTIGAEELANLKGIDRQNPLYSDYKTVIRRGFHQMRYQLKQTGLGSDFISKLLSVLFMGVHEGYNILDLERYTYTSNKKSNMLLDMIQVDRIPRKAIRLAKTIVDIDPDSGILKYNVKKLKTRKISKAMIGLEKILPGSLTIKVSNPVYLGSSWVAPKRKKKISKEKAIGLLKSGLNSVEIAEKYNGFTQGQLAAFKYHYVTKPNKKNIISTLEQ